MAVESKQSFTYTSIEEYQAHIYDVDMSAYQTSKGGFLNVHKVVFLPNFTIGYRYVGGSVIHEALTPKNQFYFVLPLGDVEFTLDGKIHTKQNLFCCAPQEYNFSQFPPGMQNLFVSFTTEQLAKYFEPIEIEQIIKAIPAIREGKLEPNKLNLFREVIFNMFHGLFYDKMDSLYENKLDVEAVLFQSIRTLFSHAFEPQRIILNTTRKNVVARAIEYLAEDNLADISIPALASACFCSVRTLEYSFQRILGKTPLQFLRMRKMHSIRRELIASSGESVSAILSRNNVSNQGRFAKEYFMVFGESPLQTLKHRN